MKPESGKVTIYPVVILLGFGFSMMLVNSLGLGTELIGDNKVNILSAELSFS